MSGDSPYGGGDSSPDPYDRPEEPASSGGAPEYADYLDIPAGETEEEYYLRVHEEYEQAWAEAEAADRDGGEPVPPIDDPIYAEYEQAYEEHKRLWDEHEGVGSPGQEEDTAETAAPEPARIAGEPASPATASPDTSAGRALEGVPGGAPAEAEEGASDAARRGDPVLVWGTPPEARAEQPGEAAPDTAGVRQPDSPAIAEMDTKLDRVLSLVENMQAKLDASEARSEESEARLGQEIGALKTENAELREKLAAWEARGGGDRRAGEDSPWASGVPDSGGLPDVTEQERLGIQGRDDIGDDDIEQADAAAIDRRGDDEAVKEAKKSPELLERLGHTPESADFWKSVAGVAGAAGFSVPGMDLLTGGDATRRALEKMTPDEQLAAMRMGEAVTNAFGSMSPGTALAALGASVVFPGLKDKFLDVVHRAKRKD